LVSALNNVLLPTLGSPTIPMVSDMKPLTDDVCGDVRRRVYEPLPDGPAPSSQSRTVPGTGMFPPRGRDSRPRQPAATPATGQFRNSHRRGTARSDFREHAGARAGRIKTWSWTSSGVTGRSTAGTGGSTGGSTPP